MDDFKREDFSVDEPEHTLPADESSSFGGAADGRTPGKAEEPVINDAFASFGSGEPAGREPVVSEPVVRAPIHGEPVANKPVHSEQAGKEPIGSEPARNEQQPSGGMARGAEGARYLNDGYGKGRQYSSSYDSYRFETPVDPAPINTNETRYRRSRSQKMQGVNKDGRRNMKLMGIFAGVIVLFGLVSILAYLGISSLSGKKVSEPAQEKSAEITPLPTPAASLKKPEEVPEAAAEEPAEPNIDAAAGAVNLTVPQVVEQCMPSMVAITNTTIEEYHDFFGGTSKQESVSAGSGIIVGETEQELLIATNNHVIENSNDITVTFIDESAIPGAIKGMDADNDLAIVAVKLEDIKPETKEAIKVIAIGDSDATVVGESVVAIGNALGYGQSVSAGIVSALGRNVDLGDGQKHELIQTDASINPGNSGGALINMRGELIGINEVKYVDETVEGVGYAIPMATAEPILSSLGSKAARQKVDDEHASYLGIKCTGVPYYYVQAGYPAGVYVSEVTKGGPADAAGLKEGDIITAIDGIRVSSSAQLVNYLNYYAAGEVIDFSVSRLNEDNTGFNGSKMPITLGSRKEAGLAGGKGGKDAGDGEKDEEAPADESTAGEASKEGDDGIGILPILPDAGNQ